MVSLQVKDSWCLTVYVMMSVWWVQVRPVLTDDDGGAFVYFYRPKKSWKKQLPLGRDSKKDYQYSSGTIYYCLHLHFLTSSLRHSTDREPILQRHSQPQFIVLFPIPLSSLFLRLTHFLTLPLPSVVTIFCPSPFISLCHPRLLPTLLRLAQCGLSPQSIHIELY